MSQNTKKYALGTWVTTAAVFFLSTLTLTGCSAANEIQSASTSNSAAQPTSTPRVKSSAPSPTTSASPSATTQGTPLNKSCEELVELGAVQRIGVNFELVAPNEVSPTVQTKMMEQVAGTVCQYSIAQSDEIITVGVSKPNSEYLKTIKSQLVSEGIEVKDFGTPPETFGFFSRSNEIGTGQIIYQGYWISIESSWFYEPTDFSDLVRTIQESL